MTRRIVFAATTLTTMLLMAIGQAQTPPSPAPPPVAAPPTFPEGVGKTALFKLCRDCHGPEMVAAELRTRAEWSKTLDTMADHGAQGSDEEFTQVLDYLARHFSPIQINKAPANELEAVMDVSAAVAEAIVSYRAAQGNFTSIDDLKKVPGVEAGKVDARRERLIF